MTEQLSAGVHTTGRVKPVRYHFTDEKPFAVSTAEGEVKLGTGWLAISEAEYAALTKARNANGEQC